MFKRLCAMPKPAELLNVLTASAVYIILLVIPPPPFISQALNQSGWMILLLLVGIFTLLLRQKGTAWEAIQGIFVFGLFALLLIHQWQFVPNYGEIIGGLLPWSDASGYLQEAQRVLNGSLLTSFGARRPLFPAFLAVLLQLTGRNFMVSLAVLTWINALAVLLVVREVKRSYGAVGASVLLIIAYKFYLRFAGTTMTEQLGFARVLPPDRCTDQEFKACTFWIGLALPGLECTRGCVLYITHPGPMVFDDLLPQDPIMAHPRVVDNRCDVAFRF